jgi:WD40 repeat protein
LSVGVSTKPSKSGICTLGNTSEHSLDIHLKFLSVAISPDGQTLVSGSIDKTIKVWNLHTGELIRTLKGVHLRFVILVAISPDGHMIMSGSLLDQTLQVWNLHTGELIRTLVGHSS